MKEHTLMRIIGYTITIGLVGGAYYSEEVPFSQLPESVSYIQSGICLVGATAVGIATAAYSNRLSELEKKLTWNIAEAKKAEQNPHSCIE